MQKKSMYVSAFDRLDWLQLDDIVAITGIILSREGINSHLRAPVFKELDDVPVGLSIWGHLALSDQPQLVDVDIPNLEDLGFFGHYCRRGEEQPGKSIFQQFRAKALLLLLPFGKLGRQFLVGSQRGLDRAIHRDAKSRKP